MATFVYTPILTDMKRILLIISLISLVLPFDSVASYDKNIEKTLKKRYKQVTYLAHSDVYMVSSKIDKESYGVCNSEGKDIIPANYKKISFEQVEDGDVVMFAMNPTYMAQSQGNIVYTLRRGKVLDVGRSEPIYIPGGYVTTHGKSIYNLAGNVVLDCEQNAVQPIRVGREIKGYKVSNRRMINNAAKDELIVCGPVFNQLFKLDGTGYLWKVEIDDTSGQGILWRCSKSTGGDDFMTLFFAADGSPIEDVEKEKQDVKASSQPLIAESSKTKQQEFPKATPNNESVRTAAVRSKKVVSDVDLNPPVSNTVADKTFAVIICNEEYSEVENVKYALNDGQILSNYFEKTLGVPKTNIKLVPNATLNNMRKQINWLKQIADAFGNEAKVIFYYSGHGIPDEKSSNAYLMPVDGYHSDMTTNLSVNALYDELASLKVSQVAVFLDACFSGSQRGDNMLVSARGVKKKAKANAPKGKLIVFSAAQGDETAYPLEDKGHGMFTYFLLKKLREAGDKVTLGELSDYITKEVKKASLLQNGKIQTPATSVSLEIENEWKSRSL